MGLSLLTVAPPASPVQCSEMKGSPIYVVGSPHRRSPRSTRHRPRWYLRPLSRAASLDGQQSKATGEKRCRTNRAAVYPAGGRRTLALLGQLTGELSCTADVSTHVGAVPRIKPASRVRVMDAGDDPYAVLGLKPDADAAARRAYRRLALRLHRQGSVGGGGVRAAQAAWAALGSPEARAAHDAARAPAARAVVWMDVPLRAFAAGGAGARSYPCRCGGAFEIFDDEPCADGDLVPCDGCSAHVRLVA